MYSYVNRTIDRRKNSTITGKIVFSNATTNVTTEKIEIYPPSETVPNGLSRKYGLNVLGIVVFSIVFGIVLGRLGDRGTPLKLVLESMNEVIMQMITIVMW